MSKRRYQSPTITDVGSLAELTQASLQGSRLDADYPAGTPISRGILS